MQENITLKQTKVFFGIIYQSVLRNPTLSLTAKGIYAYLSTFADRNGLAFPSQARMAADLSLGLGTLQKHLKALEQVGGMKVRRTPRGNRYLLPKEGGAFGKVEKEILLKRDLSCKAKGIYAYFSSFVGKNDFAFPRRSTILKELSIGKDSYTRHLAQLKEAGMLFVAQQTTGGRFNGCHYTPLSSFKNHPVPGNLSNDPKKAGHEKSGHEKPPSLYQNRNNKKQDQKKQDLISSIKDPFLPQELPLSLQRRLRFSDLEEDLHQLSQEGTLEQAALCQEISTLLLEKGRAAALSWESLSAKGKASFSYEGMLALIDRLLEKAPYITHFRPYVEKSFQSLLGIQSQAGPALHPTRSPK